ncbi:structure-specific endonuclease subunit slx1-like [Miscanthus floridulus]|uniref:structure-specific endonuclease subunit slx1-like n=1 Tax=Miscanthus floridulus TaxID=154761 RepID=UPI003459FDE8
MSLTADIHAAKIPRALPLKCGELAAAAASASVSGDPPPGAVKCRKAPPPPWCVYLIASSRIPRTYVGVTTDFPRRLRQHNGELKGGAKAASAGRPWNLACLVEGFANRSEACEFESKSKNISRKMARKRTEPSMKSVLRHREAALSRLEAFMDCSHLQIRWQSS